MPSIYIIYERDSTQFDHLNERSTIWRDKTAYSRWNFHADSKQTQDRQLALVKVAALVTWLDVSASPTAVDWEMKDLRPSQLPFHA